MIKMATGKLLSGSFKSVHRVINTSTVFFKSALKTMVAMLSGPNKHNQAPKGLQPQQRDMELSSASTSPCLPIGVMIALLLYAPLPHLLHYSKMKRNLVINTMARSSDEIWKAGH